MADRVRTHTRRTATGKTATVRQHGRKGRPSKPQPFTYRHVWQSLRRAAGHARKGRRTQAIAWGCLALGEGAVRLAFDGGAFVLGTACVIGLSVAWLTLSTGGLRK